MRISSSVGEKQILTPSHWGRFWTDTQRPMNSSNQSLQGNRSKIIVTLRKQFLHWIFIPDFARGLQEFTCPSIHSARTGINTPLSIYHSIFPNLLVLAFLLCFSFDPPFTQLSLQEFLYLPQLCHPNTGKSDKNKWHFMSLCLALWNLSLLISGHKCHQLLWIHLRPRMQTLHTSPWLKFTFTNPT